MRSRVGKSRNGRRSLLFRTVKMASKRKTVTDDNGGLRATKLRKGSAESGVVALQG